MANSIFMIKKIRQPIQYFIAGFSATLAVCAVLCSFLLLKSPYSYKVYVTGFWTIETQLAYVKLSPAEKALLFEYVLCAYMTDLQSYQPVTVQEALNIQRKLHTAKET